MTISAIINLEIDAPAEVYAWRDVVAEKLRALRAEMPDGASIVGPDFHAWARTNEVCGSRLSTAEAQLIAAAKKLGLTPVGAPDISYGCHGAFTGPIKLWYQIRAT